MSKEWEVTEKEGERHWKAAAFLCLLVLPRKEYVPRPTSMSF